jgi:hypothetical protein
MLVVGEPTIGMNSNVGKRSLNHIVSPYGLAAISYAFFLFCCLIPPSVYSHIIGEPDLMFLDPKTILFYSLCVMSFVAGVWLIGWLFPSSFIRRKTKTKISPTAFLLVPLVVSIGATAISIFLLIKQHPEILILLLSQQSADLKQTLALDVEGGFTRPTYLLIGTIWWAFWRSRDLDLRKWRRRLINLTLSIGVLAVIIMASVSLLRNLLMMVVCGLAILYAVRKTVNKELTGKLLLRGSLAMGVSAVLLFFATSFTRGTVDWSDHIYQITGYTVASYNRLASLMNGGLRYPFAGRGIYLSYVVAYNHALNLILPLSSAMSPPEFLDLWGSEFDAVSRAGLNSGLIWSGTFGYIYSDLGWFSLPFVFSYGLLYGCLWRQLKRGAVIGVVLYPLLGYNVLEWWGTNGLLDQPLVLLIVIGITFICYEGLLVRTTETPGR